MSLSCEEVGQCRMDCAEVLLPGSAGRRGHGNMAFSDVELIMDIDPDSTRPVSEVKSANIKPNMRKMGNMDVAGRRLANNITFVRKFPHDKTAAGSRVCRLRSKTSAERRKETAFQGSFRSEGTGDRRGLQPGPLPRRADLWPHSTGPSPSNTDPGPRHAHPDPRRADLGPRNTDPGPRRAHPGPHTAPTLMSPSPPRGQFP